MGISALVLVVWRMKVSTDPSTDGLTTPGISSFWFEMALSLISVGFKQKKWQATATVNSEPDRQGKTAAIIPEMGRSAVGAQR